MANHKPRPLCIRLPDDLHMAVLQLAQNQGMNVSEWVRDMLFRVVYGTPPGVEEGYMQGRQIGVSAALAMIHEAVKQVIEALPATAEEAIPLTQLGSPGRGGG